MLKNKQIINRCPSFYKIINYEYYEDDLISQKLINLYEEYIFTIDISDKDEVRNIEQFDRLLNKYIDDYFFRKEIKSNVNNLKIKDEQNILRQLVESIIKIFERYESGYTRNIYISRWI